MIKFEHCEVIGWEHAIRGMRNPMNSWDKSDSEYRCPYKETDAPICGNCTENICVGPNDHDLMMRLRNAGTDHRKFMQMINVYVDITAPLYWWKEFDTYKVGTVANSCSTVHKIHAKEFTLEDFSTEHLIGSPIPRFKQMFSATEFDAKNGNKSYSFAIGSTPIGFMNCIVEVLNTYRNLYLRTKDKHYWWQMIQLLPSSYNQRRTVMMNYEVLANIYKSRKNHKLDEWRTFCSWIEELPYSEIIVGELEEDITSFLTKNLVIPADEIRAGFLSGISADPNTAVVDAINGVIKGDEQNAT